MDKELFKKTLEPLGEFKQRWGDNDIFFRSYPASNLCPVCNHGYTITIERKLNRNDEPYWRWKCSNCKNHWQKLPIS